MTEFHHGITAREALIGKIPLRNADTNTIAMLAFADDADENAFPLNTPVLVTSINRFLSKAGATGNLRKNLEIIASITSPTLIVIRVKDPFANEKFNQSLVIGTTDENGKRTGLQALLTVKSVLGIIPKIICVSDTETIDVANALGAICKKLRAYSYITPRDENGEILQKAEAVSAYREMLAFREIELIWPEWTSENIFSGREKNIDAISVGISPDLQYWTDDGETRIRWNIEVDGVLYEAGIIDKSDSYLEKYLQANKETLGITGEYEEAGVSGVYVHNIMNIRKFVRLIPDKAYTSNMTLLGNPTATIDSDGVISFWLEANNEIIEPEPEIEYRLTIDDKGLLPTDNIYSGTIEPPLVGAVLSFNIQQTLSTGGNARVFNIYSDPQGLIVSPDGSSWKIDKSTVAPSWDFPSTDDFTRPATYQLSIEKMFGTKTVISANLEYIVENTPFSINKADLVFKIDSTERFESAFKIHNGDLVINAETGEVLWESPFDNFTPAYTFLNGIYVFRRSPTATAPMRWEVGGRALVEVIQFPETEYVNGLGFCVERSEGMDSSIIKVPTSLPVNITDLSRMFLRCGLFNQDISSWDVSNVTNMRKLFCDAAAFNQPFFTNTSNVTSMEELFAGAINFNQPLNLDTSKVRDMTGMFKYAFVFNQDLSNWCVPLITLEPSDFSIESPLTEEYKPVWGTCPNS